MSTINLTPKTAPIAPINRNFALPSQNIDHFIDRIANNPSTLYFEIDESKIINGDHTDNFISIYFEKNNGFYAIPTAYIYTIKIA